jgi:hypothetical protein
MGTGFLTQIKDFRNEFLFQVSSGQIPLGRVLDLDVLAFARNFILEKYSKPSFEYWFAPKRSIQYTHIDHSTTLGCRRTRIWPQVYTDKSKCSAENLLCHFVFCHRFLNKTRCIPRDISIIYNSAFLDHRNVDLALACPPPPAQTNLTPQRGGGWEVCPSWVGVRPWPWPRQAEKGALLAQCSWVKARTSPNDLRQICMLCKAKARHTQTQWTERQGQRQQGNAR